MKQKIVIQLSMKKGQKYRTKALKIAAGVSGSIEKLSLEGDEKDKVEIVGEGLDVIELVNVLRKGFGNARLVTVSAVEENDGGGGKEKDEEEEEGNTEQPINWFYGWGTPAPFYCQYYHDPYSTYSYSIW